MGSLAGREAIPYSSTGFISYNLRPPAMLLPDLHRRKNVVIRHIPLGRADDAELTIITWTGCETSCHSSGLHVRGRSVKITVKCDSLPHCSTCEHGSEHTVYLSEETAAQITESLT